MTHLYYGIFGDACGPGSTLIRLQALRSLAGIRYDPYREKF
ncbi:hypothetical protein ABIC45_000390 [Mucilaginibacter rubeus]